MKISVVIPTYNRASFRKSTLETVFYQTVPVYEVVLVDDGSTDNTREAVDTLLAEHPDWSERLRYFHQDNQGKSGALNNGLRRVTGDWIAFNDSDDRWLPEKLEWQLRALEKFPECGGCVTDSVYENNPRFTKTAFAQAGRSYPDELGELQNAPWIFAGDWPGVYMQTALVRAEVMWALGEFDPELWIDRDIDFLFRLVLATPVCYVNRPLVAIDRTERRDVGLTTEFHPRGFLRLSNREQRLRKWSKLVGPSQGELRRFLERRLALTRSEIANFHLAGGGVVSAREVLSRGIREGSAYKTRLGFKLLLTYLAPGWLCRRVKAFPPEEQSARP